MQLVAYGAQDIYLTGNPQITFFKVVYRRHTNFSMETIQQTVNGTSTLSASSNTTGTVTVSRNGDLLGIHVVKPSGQKILDDTAIQLARLASPFAPLPTAIKRKTNVLHITRTWRFTNNAELFGAPRIRIN